MSRSTTPSAPPPQEVCLACGNRRWRWAFQKSSVDFWRCGECGLVRQFPLPTVAQLEQHYKEIHESGICSVYLQYEWMRTGIFEHWWSVLESVPHFPTSGRLLDVGCSSGTLMEVAARRGWQVFGVEPTEEAAQRARKKHGSRVFHGFLRDAPLEAETFDLVAFFDVFEHLPNPEEVFAEASRVLKAGGWIAVTTANTRSLMARLLRERWVLYIPNEHLFYANGPAITRFLARYGVEVRMIRRAVKYMPLEYAVSVLRFLGPEFHRVLRHPLRWLPRAVREYPLPLYGGEMLVIAQKTGAAIHPWSTVPAVGAAAVA